MKKKSSLGQHHWKVLWHTTLKFFSTDRKGGHCMIQTSSRLFETNWWCTCGYMNNGETWEQYKIRLGVEPCPVNHTNVYTCECGYTKAKGDK